MDFKTEVLNNFIVLEGLDGSGTTTQINLLSERCGNEQIPFFATCEPTTGFIGRIIRTVLSGEEKTAPGTLARLFTADRHEHIFNPENGIKAQIDRNRIVFCDRYLFSSLAYQSIAAGFEEVLELNCHFPLPEHLFFIEVSHEECQNRMSGRESREIFEELNIQKKIDDFYQRGINLFRESGMNIHYIDGTLKPLEILEKIWRTAGISPIIK